MARIRVAVVGLGFGANFIPVYQAHPDSECAAVCRRDPAGAGEAARRFGVEKFFSDYGELLRDPEIDAVHILAPVPEHAPMTIAALRAGKHVACTVPMAESVGDCRRIVELCEQTGLAYMMMETAVFTREFLFVKRLISEGKLGRLQFLRGSHQQNKNVPNCAPYWLGLPPMHYATHAVAPLLALAGTDCEYVHCLGSGTIGKEYAAIHGSPFSVETAILKLRDSDLACEVTRSLFDVIRQYRESIDVYGTKMSLEWEQTRGDGMVEFTGIEDARRIPVPDSGHLLPAEMAPLTSADGREAGSGHTSFLQGGGHGGSYPHLVHEFLSAIRQGRESSVNATTAANWTAVGLAAHESALAGGKRVEIPDFRCGGTAGAGRS
ncbi:MAG: Gfo/Idh/MocA family oxidoreductase [Planctomycetota bacterium]|jgi:predicted dehydrogenase|nr:Gfo/Idh/MocA family oxidoreductase [Planctomycetota bacterium]